MKSDINYKLSVLNNDIQGHPNATFTYYKHDNKYLHFIDEIRKIMK